MLGQGIKAYHNSFGCPRELGVLSMLLQSLTTVCIMCTMQPIQDDQATEKQPDMFLSSIHPPLR